MQLARVPLVLIFIIASSAICFGQGSKTQPKPDLSGTWEFDRKRSNVGKSSSSSNPPEQIKITHVDPELKIRRQILVNGQREERELTYYTDERGETNPTTAYVTTNPGAQSAPRETKSKTSWSGNKIVSRSIFRPPPGGAIIEFQIVVEWRLSSDGKTLTHTTRTDAKRDLTSNAIFVSGGGRDFKAVYNLISK